MANVQDYELLLRVRADLQQALSGLDGVRKRLDSVGSEAERTGQRTVRAVDGINGKLEAVKHVLAGIAIAEGFRAVIAAVTESEDAVTQLDARLKATRGTVGLSRDALIELSAALQQVTTFGDEAVLGVENLLLSFRNIRGDVFKQTTEAVLDLSVGLSQDLRTSAVQLGKALNDPVQGLTALGKAGVQFSDQQKNVIKQLVATGKIAEAQKLILAELSSEFGGSARAAANTFGGALQQLKNAAGDLLEGDGGGLKQTTQAVRDLTATLQDPQVKAGFNTIVQGLITVAGLAAKATAAFAGFGKAVAEAFRDDAEKSLDGLLQKRVRLDAELTSLKTNANDPLAKLFGLHLNKKRIAELEGEIKALDALYVKRLKAAQAAADPAPSVPPSAAAPTLTVTTPKASTTSKAPDRTGQYLAAADALRQKLIDLQAAIDPTAAAWATYNKAVDEANKQADLAKQAPRANIEAIEAQRKAVIALLQTQRDAALDALADKDRQAYERLRQELRTPMQVAMENALGQIKELNDALDKGIIKAPEYQQQLQRIGQTSVVAAPQYQGVAPEVGGVSGEINKNLQAMQDLDAWHAQALQANEAFRQQDTASEEAYQAGLAEIQAQYAQRRQVIEQSRQQLTLAAASDFFGSLSQLSTSHNRTAARVGKTAAVMQAMIGTYTSATEAYKALAGIPVVGPALGAAAAAAAIAAGLANVAQIRSQNASFDTGGYTGPGGKHQVAGVVHAGEVVHRQEVVRQPGALPFLLDFNKRGMPALHDYAAKLNGYADGGLVGPMASTADFPQPRPTPSIPTAPVGGAGQGGGARIRIVNAAHPELVRDFLDSSEGEQVVMNIIGRNKTTVRTLVG